MRFIINSATLAKYLQSISGVLTPNNTLSVLDSFLFQLEENSLNITASDLETTIVVKIELENASINDGINQVAIPAKMLLDILKTFSDIPLTFNVNGENFGVEISSGEGKYKLAGKDPQSYPLIPSKQDTKEAMFSSSSLVNAISKTIFAACNDELRPQMSGIFCELTPEYTTFVATDAHKLVRYRCLETKVDETSSFILPKKPLNLLKNILTSRKEVADVVMEYNNINVFFNFENFNIACRLIDAKYPNYEVAIPKENPNKLIVDRESFLNTIRRVGIFANQSTHQVRIGAQGSEIMINAEDVEFSNEATERLACNYEGEPMEIGFNGKFLVEMLSNIDTEQALIEMSQPNRAGIILPMETEPQQHEDILMLVMPVMLAN